MINCAQCLEPFVHSEEYSIESSQVIGSDIPSSASESFTRVPYIGYLRPGFEYFLNGFSAERKQLKPTSDQDRTQRAVSMQYFIRKILLSPK